MSQRAIWLGILSQAAARLGNLSQGVKWLGFLIEVMWLGILSLQALSLGKQLPYVMLQSILSLQIPLSHIIDNSNFQIHSIIVS